MYAVCGDVWSMGLRDDETSSLSPFVCVMLHSISWWLCMRNYSDAPFFWNKFVQGWFWSGVPELRILINFFNFQEMASGEGELSVSVFSSGLWFYLWRKYTAMRRQPLVSAVLSGNGRSTYMLWRCWELMIWRTRGSFGALKWQLLLSCREWAEAGGSARLISWPGDVHQAH